jgi:hypothetical protein
MDLHHQSKRSAPVKMCAAVIGGSAMVALAALGVAIGQESGGAAEAKSSSMSVGGTTTQTTPSAAPATGVAQPTIKGPAPLPSEEAAAR